MWSKVARLASPAPRKPSTTLVRADGPTFARLCDSIRDLLSAGDSPTLVQTFRVQLGQLAAILKLETTQTGDGLLGPCIEYALREGVFDTLVDRVEKDEPNGVRVAVIEWFARAVVELDEGFLAHSAVNKPLIKLLRACVDDERGLARDDELAVVATMCTVCERIKTRPELLAIFLRHKPPKLRKGLSPTLVDSIGRPSLSMRLSSSGDDARPTSPPLSHISASDVSTSVSYSNASSSTSRQNRSERDFLLFSYLLRFIHREGGVGDSARRGVLSLCDVALGYLDVDTPSSLSSTLPRSTSEATITPSLPDGPSLSFSSNPSTREAVLAFSEYLLDSDFAQVLGAGLGALYGLLPTKLVVRPTRSGGQAGEVVDGVISKSAGGMQLGGMGALGEEEEAEEIERNREEEEDRLKSMGVGLSGTAEVRDGIDALLKLVEFTHEVLKRCAAPRSLDEADEGAAVDDMDDSRQRALLLSALTDSILTALSELFLRSVLYPSILECSEEDGSAVAVMSYIDALLEVVVEGSQLEGAVLGFLFGEEDSPVDQPKRPSLGVSPQPSRRVRARKSSALLLIEQASMPHHHGSSYFTSMERFTLRDLLVAHLHSSSQSTATSALKLLQTILTKHDRWSLALLDVVLDEGATSFPIRLRKSEKPFHSASDSLSPGSPLNDLVKEEESDGDDSSDEEFVYPSSDSLPMPRDHSSAPTPILRPSFLTTPNTPFGSSMGAPLGAAPSVSLHFDHLDTLLSLVSSIDPTYRQARSVGAESEMLSSAFTNYLRDAEASLASDRGFQRGIHSDPKLDNVPLTEQPRRRKTLFGTKPTSRGRDYASAVTGTRHKMNPNGELVALLLDSFSHFFSHSPETNLALTAVISSLAAYPYRSLDGWLLPVIRQLPESSDLEVFLRDGPRRATLSDDGDDRSVDFEVEERTRQSSLLSPPPQTPQHFDPKNPPPSATRAALSQSDSLLAILNALVKSVDQYRAKIPKFDTYLSERRRGLFFVENLAEALHLDDLVSSDTSFSSPEPAPSLPLPATPASKPIPSGLASFFSPRRPSHNRSPSTPLNKSFSTPEHSSALPKPSRLRRAASNESIAVGLSVPRTRGADARNTASSPFVAHYRQTGSINVEPVIVSTPGSKLRATKTLRTDDEETDDEDVPDDEAAPDSPSRRLSPLPPLAPSSTSGASSASEPHPTRFGSPTSRAGERGEVRATVTLSTILDNVILLEEFIKELAAVIFVRREVGIDAVRFS